VSSALIMRVRQIKEIEVEGLGLRIQQARSAIAGIRSLDQICEEVGVSRTYWYDLEAERIKGTLSIENLRKIEQALNIDFGVTFDD
jgi:transcriptional regulator with XRE-family HTH domain